MSDSNLIVFPGGTGPTGPTPTPPEDGRRPEPSPPLGPEQRHQLEVRLDVARERVLLWRIAVVFAALTGLMLLRHLAIGA